MPFPIPSLEISIRFVLVLIRGTVRSKMDKNNDNFGEMRPNKYTILSAVMSIKIQQNHMQTVVNIKPFTSPYTSDSSVI